jgi:hypothetical protein
VKPLIKLELTEEATSAVQIALVLLEYHRANQAEWADTLDRMKWSAEDGMKLAKHVHELRRFESRH